MTIYMIIVNLVGTILLRTIFGLTMGLVDNTFADILLNYIVALSGSIAIVNISVNISNSTFNLSILITHILSYIGRNTLYFYPLTGFIPDLCKIVINDSALVKVFSRIFSFLFTYCLIELKNIYKIVKSGMNKV